MLYINNALQSLRHARYQVYSVGLTDLSSQLFAQAHVSASSADDQLIEDRFFIESIWESVRDVRYINSTEATTVNICPGRAPGVISLAVTSSFKGILYNSECNIDVRYWRNKKTGGHHRKLAAVELWMFCIFSLPHIVCCLAHVLISIPSGRRCYCHFSLFVYALPGFQLSLGWRRGWGERANCYFNQA